MEVCKKSEMCDGENSIIVDLKTSESFGSMDVFDYLSVERIVKTTKERVLNLTNIALRLVINY